MARFFIVLSLCWGLALAQSTKPWLKTVPVDLDKYVGRWYQMAGCRFNWATQGDTICTTADYRLYNSTTISVYNSGRFDKPADGEVTEIRGRALVTPNPGQFRLLLDGVPEGTYWVLKLGPVVSGKYDHVVVSAKSGLPLFVMVRDPKDYPKYKTEIYAFLKEQKFDDFLTGPVEMYNGDECVYQPEP